MMSPEAITRGNVMGGTEVTDHEFNDALRWALIRATNYSITHLDRDGFEEAAFFAVCAARKSYRRIHGTTFKTWTFKYVQAYLLKEGKRQALIRQHEFTTLDTPFGDSSIRMIDLLVDPTTLPKQDDCFKEALLAQIRFSLEFLSAYERQTVELYYWKDLSMEEIAKRRGVSRQAIHACLKKAQLKIGDQLKTWLQLQK